MAEALLAVAVFSLLATAFVGATLYGEEATMLSGNRSRAALLADEGLEAVRNIRDAGYANLTDGTFGLTPSTGVWTFSGSQDTNDIFTRAVTIASVDAKRKQVTSTVTWRQNTQRNGSLSLTTYLTNWIAVSGIGNWALPAQIGSYDLSGTADGSKVSVSGNYAYIVRNVSGSENFEIMDISNPAAPSLAGALTLSGTPTNVIVSGNFAYISNQSSTQELQIVDISTPTSPSLAGSYDAPGTAAANSLAVVGTTVYLGRAQGTDKEFLIINASNPAAATLVGSLDIAAAVADLVVSGNYAYIALSAPTAGNGVLQVVNITTPSAPTPGTIDTSSSGVPDDRLALVGNTLFLGQEGFSRAGTVTFLEAYDISTPASPVGKGTVDIGYGTLGDIDIDPSGTYAFVATSIPTAEFATVNITNLAAMTIAGTVDIAGSSNLYGVAYQSVQDRAYVVGDPDTQELMVFKPQ